jgi:hypothetical protein
MRNVNLRVLSVASNALQTTLGRAFADRPPRECLVKSDLLIKIFRLEVLLVERKELNHGYRRTSLKADVVLTISVIHRSTNSYSLLTDIVF